MTLPTDDEAKKAAQVILNKSALYEAKALEIIRKYRPYTLENEIPGLMRIIMEYGAFLADDILDEFKNLHSS